jgi:hypothetical protein
MNSFSLKEAAGRRGVSESRITQLANEEGSGVWRVERGRYSFDPPQDGSRFSSENEMLYKVKWLAEKGEFKESGKITEKFFQSEIDNPDRAAGKRAIALLNLSWLEDTLLRELSGTPEQSYSEMFNGFEIGDGFSDEQLEYLINHRHFEIGLLTPEDRRELAKIIEKNIERALTIESVKNSFPRLDHDEWQIILIEIISGLLESRIEREGKERLAYVDQASKILNDMF